jgi:DNA-binding transcriptional LysR family regulator
MDLRWLECFVAVAEELHFGRAAERLYLGQPTVSEAVRRLEADLGGSLFDRSSRRVRLTALGEQFLPEARDALLQVRRAYEVGRTLAQQAGEMLSVGYAEHVGHDLLLRCLPELRAQFPSTTPVPRRLDTSVQLDALERGTLDIGIGWGPVASPTVTVKRLSRERFVALLPDSHPLAAHRRLRPEALSGQGILTWPHQVNSGLCDRLITAFEQAGASLRIVRTADGVAAIGTHVAAGVGIGMAVTSALPDHALPGIRTVPLTGPSTTADRVLLLPKKTLRPAQTRLADLLLSIGSTATSQGESATSAVDAVSP